MSVVDLELFRAHARIDEYADEDTYLEHLLDTAQESVLTACNRTLDEMYILGEGELPNAFTHAILLLAAHWYANRESVAGVQMHEIPDGLLTLTKPLRRLV